MLLWIIGALVLALGALWVFGPREPLGPKPAAVNLPQDLNAYLAQAEAQVPNLRPAAAKRIDWAGAPGAKTPLSLVYFHGFSASAVEISPVPERVAANLGANLHFTRFTGHGRDGPAMADATVPAWRADGAEALAIARAIGDKVVVIATSNGAPILVIDLIGAQNIAGVIFVAPHFKLHGQTSRLLTLPFARQIIPRAVGPTRGFEPENALQAEGWTTSYPSEALAPLGAVAMGARAQPVEDLSIPALFIISDADEVVDAQAARDMAARWGGPVTIETVDKGPGIDPEAHVLAGDAVSPAMTDTAVRLMTTWIEGLKE